MAGATASGKQPPLTARQSSNCRHSQGRMRRSLGRLRLIGIKAARVHRCLIGKAVAAP